MVRRSLSAALWVLTVVVASAAVVLVLLVGRLASGPVSLELLTPYIEAALTPEDGAYRFEIGDTAIRLSQERGIELAALDARGIGPDGELLFALPEVTLDLDLKALLIDRAVAFARLDAEAPSLILIRNEDGGIGLASRIEQGGRSQRLDLGALVAPLLAERDPKEPLSYLETVHVRGGELVIEDRITQTTLQASNADLLLTRVDRAVHGRLDFRLQQPAHAVAVSITGRYAEDASAISYQIEVTGLRPGDVAPFVPAIPTSGLDLTLSGRVFGEVTLEGEFLQVGFALQSDGGVFDLADRISRPIELDDLELRGRLELDPVISVAIDELRFRAHGARVQAKGEGAWQGAGLELQAEVEAEGLGVSELDRFWPPGFGDQAREWVLENIPEGHAPRGRVEIQVAPGDLAQRPWPRDALSGWFEYRDVTVRYFRDFPPVTGIDGRATFDAQDMHFTASGGAVGEIVVESGTVAITGIGIKGDHTTQLEVVADARGPLQEALALLEREPLGYASRLGLDPAAVAGRAQAELRFGLPIYREVKAEDLRVAADARLSDVSAAGLFGRVDLEQGQFDLQVTREGMDLDGDAVVEQIPLAIEWRENFGDRPEIRRRFRLTGTVEATRLEALGVAPLPPDLEGSFDAVISGVQSAPALQLDAVLDLAGLGLALPWLDWRKAPGEPGDLGATLSVPEDGPIRVSDFQLNAAGLEALGSLELEREPIELRMLALDRLSVGEQRLSGILRREDGRYRAEVVAQILDLEPLLAGMPGDDAAELPPLEIDLTAERVMLRGHAFEAVDAHLEREADVWRAADITARLPSGGQIDARLVPEGNAQRLSISSADAGELLAFLDQTNRIRGGHLALDARIAAQKPALRGDGELRIESFTLFDAPILARLLTLASLRGIGNVLEGDGIDFDILQVPFRFADGVVTIERGRMTGSQLGLTFEGLIDVENGRLDLHGTVVPVYTINRIIARIPVIGDFLSGGEGEGAFAATFTITGRSDDPEVLVNPLSVLAPGFIRELLSGIREGTLEAPTLPGENR